MNKIHILLIEDSETDAILVKHELLQAMDNQVTLAHTKRISEALELIQQQSFDSILVKHELLQAMGNQVTLVHANRMSEALELIQQQSFDLILSDLGLPDCSGIETINRLHKNAASIPITVLSSRNDEKLALQAIKAGAQDYLVKGALTEGALARVIQYSIERKRTEERTKKAQQRFQTIFEKAPLGIALINFRTGKFLDVNPMYASIVGRTIDELIQISQANIIHPEDLEVYLQSMALLDNHKIPSSKITKRILHPNGSIIWIEMSVVPFDTGEDAEVCYLCMIKDISDHRQMIANLHDLTEHLQNIREEEQTRIGREIHDVIGGTLTVLKMDLDWLSKKVTANPMHERIKSLYQLTGEAIETARRVSTNLRPNVLDNLGLHGGIEWLIREFEQRMNIECHLTLGVPNIPELDKNRETAIFRIIQEVFTNITRHAQATIVKMYIEEKDHHILFKIKDNGIGITEEQLINPKSFGIIGMHERAKQMGAQLIIKGSPSNGSVIQLQVPIQDAQKEIREVAND
jgi:two-component system, NarL family, sensor histidine kinase UhpB